MRAAVNPPSSSPGYFPCVDASCRCFLNLNSPGSWNSTFNKTGIYRKHNTKKRFPSSSAESVHNSSLWTHWSIFAALCWSLHFLKRHRSCVTSKIISPVKMVHATRKCRERVVARSLTMLVMLANYATNLSIKDM